MQVSITQFVTMMTIGALGGTLWASEPVDVKLIDGTELTAEVDRRTDESRLWLRMGGGTTIVLRPIPWQDVASARLRGEQVPVALLRRMAGSGNAARGTPSASPRLDADLSAGSHADLARLILGFAHRITEVEFDAVAARSAHDAEAVALRIQLQPRDARGRLIAVAGVLDVQLESRKNEAGRADTLTPAARRRGLARWSIRIDERDFGHRGATLQLPLHARPGAGQVLPGPIQLRLVVPGHGVFEHTVARVGPLEEWHGTRQQRLLPTEAADESP